MYLGAPQAHDCPLRYLRNAESQRLAGDAILVLMDRGWLHVERKVS